MLGNTTLTAPTQKREASLRAAKSQKFTCLFQITHLDFVQAPHDVLSVLAQVVQALFQLLHLVLECLQSRLHLRPFGVAHLAQQSLGAGLVVVQDAGEDAHVDVQGDVHQLHVFSL